MTRKMHFNASFFYFLPFYTRFRDFFLCLPCRLLYLVVTPSGVDPSHASRGEVLRRDYPHGLPAAKKILR